MNDDTKKQKTFPINKFVALFDCKARDPTRLLTKITKKLLCDGKIYQTRSARHVENGQSESVLSVEDRT